MAGRLCAMSSSALSAYHGRPIEAIMGQINVQMVTDVQQYIAT
jgi:hypothetical protein